MDRRFRYRQRHVQDVAIGDCTVRVWHPGGDLCVSEIRSALMPLAKSGFVHPYVALMPDFHPGPTTSPGVMIGCVVPTREVVLPAVAGGDLGCGMAALRLPFTGEDLRSLLPEARRRILAAIPVGTAHNAAVTDRVRANRIWQSGTRAPILTGQLRRKLQHQFGSLGGGNHFLELQEDEEEGAWVMLHSGSRFLGVAIRDHYVGLGRSVDGIDPRTYRTVPHLPATSEAAADYLADVAYAVAFALASRREMLVRVLEVLGTLRLLQADQGSLLDEAIDLEHNAVSVEEHWGERLYVHRKGATRAGTGLPGLIPGSMGSRSFVVEGRGNEHAFCSCSHGAGRAMSRAEAMRAISDEELCRSMEGVLYDHDGRLRDEAPAAYKDIGQVMRAQRDLVRIKHELRPMASIKGCT